MPREIDSEPCVDQARRMARLGFDLMPTDDRKFAVWRQGMLEIRFPAHQAFASDAALCGILIEKAIQAGAAAKQAAIRRELGLSEHS